MMSEEKRESLKAMLFDEEIVDSLEFATREISLKVMVKGLVRKLNCKILWLYFKLSSKSQSKKN
jgi:hypothetical protein